MKARHYVSIGAVACLWLFTLLLGAGNSIVAQDAPTPTPTASGRIAYRDGSSVYVIADNGSGRRVVGDDKKYIYLCPAWSRNGQQLAVVGGSDGFEMYVANPNSKAQKVVIKADSNEMPGASLSWSPDNKQIAYVGKSAATLFTVSADGKTVNSVADVGAVNVDWSPDGQSFVAFARGSDGKSGIFTFDAAGKNPTLLLALPDSDWEQTFDKDHYFTRDVVWPHWSPDGKSIVFASGKDGNLELYVMDADGQNVRRLTDNQSPDYAPGWSANGQSIVFVSEREGDKGIYVISAEGETSDNEARLVVPFRDGGCPAWQPKGK